MTCVYTLQKARAGYSCVRAVGATSTILVASRNPRTISSRRRSPRSHSPSTGLDTRRSPELSRTGRHLVCQPYSRPGKGRAPADALLQPTRLDQSIPPSPSTRESDHDYGRSVGQDQGSDQGRQLCKRSHATSTGRHPQSSNHREPRHTCKAREASRQRQISTHQQHTQSHVRSPGTRPRRLIPLPQIYLLRPHLSLPIPVPVINSSTSLQLLFTSQNALAHLSAMVFGSGSSSRTAIASSCTFDG